MAFLTHPNFAHLFVVAGVILLLLSDINPKSTTLKVGMLLCFAVAGYEFAHLRVNLWALLLAVLSPLPFFIAARQARPQNPLFLISIFMLTISSVFIFMDQNNRPVVNIGLAGFVFTLCGAFIWLGTERLRIVEGARLSNIPDSVIGMMGEARTDIEAHSAGSVLVDGELWQAHS